MKKFFDELIEKKAQESLKRENEQNIRKARLAELQEKNKGIKRRLLHPVNSVNDGKEIKKLKEDIAAFEKAKEDKRSMWILCGVLAFCMIMLLANSLFHKESNNEANETSVAMTNTESETELPIKATEETVPRIKSIRFVNLNTVKLKIGQTSSTDQLAIEFDKDYEFTTDDIQFVIDDPQIASIKIDNEKRSDNSVKLSYSVEGKAEGETSIYAMTEDGTVMSNSINITVRAPIEVESIAIEGNPDGLLIGESTVLSAVLSPKTADNAFVSWESSDEEILVVNASGRVTAVGEGTAKITATSTNGKSDYCDIYVNDSARRMKVKVDYSRDDDNDIGNEWSHVIRLNGEPVKEEMIVSVNDTLDCYAEFTESDDRPDEGRVSKSYTVTENDLQEGFEIEMELYVTENGGRNSGESAHFVITYTFIVEG